LKLSKILNKNLKLVLNKPLISMGLFINRYKNEQIKIEKIFKKKMDEYFTNWKANIYEEYILPKVFNQLYNKQLGKLTEKIWLATL